MVSCSWYFFFFPFNSFIVCVLVCLYLSVLISDGFWSVSLLAMILPFMDFWQSSSNHFLLLSFCFLVFHLVCLLSLIPYSTKPSPLYYSVYAVFVWQLLLSPFSVDHLKVFHVVVGVLLSFFGTVFLFLHSILLTIDRYLHLLLSSFLRISSCVLSWHLQEHDRSDF